MKFFVSLLILSCALPLSAQTSYVPYARLLKEKGHELFLGGDFFKSSQRVDKDRKKTKYQSGEKFERTQGVAGIRYGIAKNFQVSLGCVYRNQTVSSYDETLDQSYQASAGGLQSIFTQASLGFDRVGPWEFSLEGLYRYVPYNYSELTPPITANDNKEMMLGDVGPEYSLGAATSYSFKNLNSISLRGGWRNPGSHLSTEVYWQGEGAIVWKSVALLAGVEGVSSLNNGDEDRPQFDTRQTEMYHGLNREWIAPYVGLNFALSPTWRVELRGSQVISGRSTDLGTGFGIQLVRRVEKSDAKRVDRKFKSYDVEATVTKVSPKKQYLELDKGLGDDFRKGMALDLFEFDYVGGNVLVARGVIIQVKSETSILKVTEVYNPKKEIKTGLIARGELR